MDDIWPYFFKQGKHQSSMERQLKYPDLSPAPCNCIYPIDVMYRQCIPLYLFHNPHGVTWMNWTIWKAELLTAHLIHLPALLKLKPFACLWDYSGQHFPHGSSWKIILMSPCSPEEPLSQTNPSSHINRSKEHRLAALLCTCLIQSVAHWHLRLLLTHPGPKH